MVRLAVRELKLIGSDGKTGLLGGGSPESEDLVIQFLGSKESGVYSALVRIITQASNLGTRSTGQPGEPPDAMYYLDIPVSVRVAK